MLRIRFVFILVIIVFVIGGITCGGVGPQNFSSEALYNHLQSFSMTVDGCRHSFSETKRTSNDFLNIHQFDAERKGLFLAHEGWIPIKKEP